MSLATAFLLIVSCPPGTGSGTGFGTATIPRPAPIVLQAGALVIPTDDCYQQGLDNAAWYSPSANSEVAEQVSLADQTTCTFYDNATTPSTINPPYQAPATGGGHYCWAATTGAPYPAKAGSVIHTHGAAYALAKRQIPFYVMIAPFKKSPLEPDYEVTAVSSSINGVYYFTYALGTWTGHDFPAMSGATVFYRGAPIVVEAAFAEEALRALGAEFGTSPRISDLIVHVTRTPTGGNVAGYFDSTPKPVGILEYSNTNGYNSTIKLLTDAGIADVLGGQGSAWTTLVGDRQGNVQYTWAAGPTSGTNACAAGTCTSLTYTPTAGVETRILDTVWVPSLEIPETVLNPTLCTGAQGQCLADTCLGPNAVCCYDPAQPPVASLPAGTTTVPVSTPGGTVNYYCPCDLPASYQCDVTNYRYNNYGVAPYHAVAACYDSPWPSATPTPSPCGANVCDVTVGHCLTPCVQDLDCPGGAIGACVTMPDDPFSGTGPGQVACTATLLCPVGYSCNLVTGICSPTGKACNPLVEATTCASCNADEYCDPNFNHCEPRAGCRLECGSNPPTNAAVVWDSYASPVSGKGGVHNLVTTGGSLFATDATPMVIMAASNPLLFSSGITPWSPSALATAPINNPHCEFSVSTDGILVDGALHAGWSWLNYPSSDYALQLGDLEYRRNWTFDDIPVVGIAAQPSVHILEGTTAGGSVVGPATIGGVQQPGTVVESFVSSFVNQGTSEPEQWAGQHQLLTALTLLNATAPGCNGNTLTTSELSRSNPLPNPVTAWATRYYFGTYEWGWTDPTKMGLGNAQWLPGYDQYPYTIGHFREYTLGSGADTNSPLNTGGTWDTNCWLTTSTGDCTGSTPAARTIWTATWNGTQWTMLPVMVGNDMTIGAQILGHSPTVPEKDNVDNLIGRISLVTQLGGIDYSQPAIIQYSTIVPTGSNRPTLAYFGAADGMIHAVCVAAKTGTTGAPGTCYGASPGAELFAFIPPQTMKDMYGAYLNKDWSRIKVDGVMRVADVFDTLNTATPGVKVWDTVLIAGTRDSGAALAFVISDPDPANLNTDKFRMLWEMNAGNTTPAPGPTNGATVVTPGPTALAAVTAGNGPSGSDNAGMTTYLLNIRPATVPQSGPEIVGTQTIGYNYVTALGNKTPSLVPPLPTVVGIVSPSTDDTLLVATVDGRMIKYPITPTSLGAGVTLLDVSAWGAAGAAIPILASPSVARRPLAAGGAADPQFVMIAATGGADWTEYQVNQYMVGANVEVASPAATPWVYGTLGTEAITQPSYPPQPITYSNRGYGQPYVYGSAVVLGATSLHMGSFLWPLFPEIYGGVWGAGEIFDITGVTTTNTVRSMTPFTTSAGGAFGGGAGGAMERNGRIVVVGGAHAYDHQVSAAEATLTAPQAALNITNPGGGGGSGRSFQVLTQQEADR
jgi:hypothetical protein